MVDSQTLERIKQVPITDYLHSKGIVPVKMVGNQFLYHSPLTEEKTPSFYVEPTRNVFTCFSTGQAGDNIRLVILMNNRCSFLNALQLLQGITPVTQSFSFSGYESSSVGIELRKVKPLENRALIQYLESRKIPFSIAARYVQEAYFIQDDKQYFALAFANDKGGFELRNGAGKNGGFKGCISPKSPTMIRGTSTGRSVNVFEGFFNFLSALVYFKTTVPRCDTIVLNSLAMLEATLPRLQQYEAVNAFLDTDKAGFTALQTISAHCHTVKNYSTIYSNFKDFNELLTKQLQP